MSICLEELFISLHQSAGLQNGHFFGSFLMNFYPFGFSFFHKNQEEAIIRFQQSSFLSAKMIAFLSFGKFLCIPILFLP